MKIVVEVMFADKAILHCRLLPCQISHTRSYITVPLGRHPAERARAGLRARGLVKIRP